MQEAGESMAWVAQKLPFHQDHFLAFFGLRTKKVGLLETQGSPKHPLPQKKSFLVLWAKGVAKVAAMARIWIERRRLLLRKDAASASALQTTVIRPNKDGLLPEGNGSCGYSTAHTQNT